MEFVLFFAFLAMWLFGFFCGGLYYKPTDEDVSE